MHYDKYIFTAWRIIVGREPSLDELEDSNLLLIKYKSNIRFIDALKRIRNNDLLSFKTWSKPKSISVVINTYNRASSLGDAIRSLLNQSIEQVEVIVVIGPCTDNTRAVTEEFKSEIKILECNVKNLSVSRNVGIKAANGDVVAFIDDDAVAEPYWAEKILKGYTDSTVGGVGGWVRDHTGHTYQTKTIICDRYGMAVTDRTNAPSNLINRPGCFYYSALIGTNSSFRRDVIIEIGGFDEEYEYFLDETDVCVRVIDKGYKITQIPEATIIHKSLPSHIRSQKKIITNYYPIFKNTYYFILKNNGGHLNPIEAEVHTENIYNHHLEANRYILKEGHITEADFKRIKPEFEKAKIDAVKAWKSYSLNKVEDLKSNNIIFKKIPKTNAKLHVILTCRTYHLSDSGIAKFIKVQAEALAKLGHTVRVLTMSQTDDTIIDYKNGVWIHHLSYKHYENKTGELGFILHDSMWDCSMTMYDETCRLSELYPVDVVETPIWDCEGIAFVYHKKFPHIVHLETTMGIALEHHPDWLSSQETLKNIIYPAIQGESYIVEKSDWVRPLSNEIMLEFEKKNHTNVDRNKTTICPVAVEDNASKTGDSPNHHTNESLQIMYLGRFEERKGIDVLFKSIIDVLNAKSNVRFVLVGNNQIINHVSGERFDIEFQRKYSSYQDRVSITGKLSDDEVAALLSSSDIFVAPSRFESFGIINVEAMMFSLPVVSCKVGGIPEVVIDGQTGILVLADDDKLLTAALIRLVDDASLRIELGRNGRVHYMASFMPLNNARRMIEIYQNAITRFGKGKFDGNHVSTPDYNIIYSKLLEKSMLA